MQIEAICIGDAARRTVSWGVTRRGHVRDCPMSFFSVSLFSESLFSVSDDAALACSMRLAQAGDREAYALVLKACRDAFTRLARERCPAGCSEAEIVRRCLLALHQARHTFDPDRSFAAWVAAIARHHGLGLAPVGPGRVWRARIGLLVRGAMGLVDPPNGENAT